MSYSILETKIIWGQTFPDVMNGVEDIKMYGWKPLGMPTPIVIDDVYGMMHMVYRDRSKG